MESSYKFAKIEDLLPIMNDKLAKELFPIHFPWFQEEHTHRNYILAARALHGQGPYITQYRNFIEPLLLKKLQEYLTLSNYMYLLNKYREYSQVIFDNQMQISKLYKKQSQQENMKFQIENLHSSTYLFSDPYKTGIINSILKL